MSQRKRYRPKDCAANPVALAIAGASKLNHDQRELLRGTMLAAYESLRTGTVSGGRSLSDCWNDLADCANVGQELMQYGLAPDHMITFTDAQLALRDLCTRGNAGRGWTMYPREVDILQLLTVVHGVQLDHCSVAEFRDAVNRVRRRASEALRGNGGTVSCVTVVGNLNRERQTA